MNRDWGTVTFRERMKTISMNVHISHEMLVNSTDIIEYAKNQIRRKFGPGPWVVKFEEWQEPQWDSIRLHGWIEVEE